MRNSLQISSAGHLVKSMRRRPPNHSRTENYVFAQVADPNLCPIDSFDGADRRRWEHLKFYWLELSWKSALLICSCPFGFTALGAQFKTVKRFLPCVMVNTKELRRLFLDCPWCFSSLLGSDYHKENSLVDVVFQLATGVTQLPTAAVCFIDAGDFRSAKDLRTSLFCHLMTTTTFNFYLAICSLLQNKLNIL